MNESHAVPIRSVAAEVPTAKSMRNFGIVWFGELVSITGSSVSEFALSIWVYKTTGSVLQFSAMLLAMTLPRLLVSLFAGVIVDRVNRRTIMILSDCAQAMLSLGVLGLAFFNVLQPWHLFIGVALAAVAASFQQPAYQAMVTQLVSRDQLGKANGLLNFGNGLAQLAGPLLGGALLGTVGLVPVLLIDLITFFVAVLMVALVRVPNVQPLTSSQPQGTSPEAGFVQEFRAGWQFIHRRPALLSLMRYIAFTVFLTSFPTVLMPPLVLAFSNEQTLGVILTVGGVGLLLGGLVMSAWGGPKRRVYGLLVFDVLTGAAMIFAGFQTSVMGLTIAAFLFFVGMPISRGSAQSLWQSEVPEALQGRVFTARDMIAIGASPIALLIAGPLADGVFEPLMRANGAHPGRGIGLMFVGLGVLFLLANAVAWLSPRLRKL
jgi:MFS transporter, DHA3 family, macrolide efflux protein